MAAAPSATAACGGGGRGTRDVIALSEGRSRGGDRFAQGMLMGAAAGGLMGYGMGGGLFRRGSWGSISIGSGCSFGSFGSFD